MAYSRKNDNVIIIWVFTCIWMISCRPAAEVPALLQAKVDTDRRVIITADDYGVSESINEGVLFAARQGCISNISAFTNFPQSILGLKEIASEFPDLGIGVHLNINAGQPVSDPDLIPSLVNDNGNFYDVEEFLIHLKKISKEEVFAEFQAQINVLINNGIRLDHISSHYGVCSLYPPYFEMRNKLALEYDVPVRSPVTGSRKYPSVYMSHSGRKLVRTLARKLTFRSPSTAIQLKQNLRLEEMMKKSAKLDSMGIRHPDLMIDGFYGDPTPSNLIRILKNLPPGNSEIIVHLGNFRRQMVYPPGLDTLYLHNREFELMTISSPYVKEYMTSLKIEKITYSDLY
ncbi:carbohydrate deacetylase [Bacteroidota bacterium]